MGLFDDWADENEAGDSFQPKVSRTETVINYGENNTITPFFTGKLNDNDDILSFNEESDKNISLGLENQPSCYTDVSAKESKQTENPAFQKKKKKEKKGEKGTYGSLDISFIGRNGQPKTLKKRFVYERKDDVLNSLKDAKVTDENFMALTEDNPYTKHTFNKKIFSEFGKSHNNYGMNVEGLLKELKKEKERETSNANSNSPDEKTNLDDKLWVDKYKPANVLNIVGHEENKLNILRWLKMWSLATGGASNQFSKENVNDPFRRPEKKVLLIEGRTGIGKNLLIEVLAASCAYTLIEVNGVDSINGNVKQWLSNIIHTNNSVMGKKSVNCLMVDEASNDINDLNSNLVEILKEDEKLTNECIRYFFKNGKKNEANNRLKKLRNKLIRKPIICLTDNFSSKKLASLKPYCEIIRLKQPSMEDISSFLENILSEELGTDIDMINESNLNRFVELCNGDIRNCLNNLQFDIIDDSMNLIKRESPNLKTSNLKNYVQGKDKSKSWFNVMFDLFEPSNSQKELKAATSKLLKELEVLENSHSSMVQLAFDNYPNLVPNMETTSLQKYSAQLNNIHDSIFLWDLLCHSTDTNSRLSQYSIVTLLQFFNFNYSMYQGSSKSHKKLNKNLIKLNAWHPKFLQLQSEIKELVYLFKKPYQVNLSGYDAYVYNSSHNSRQLVQEFLPFLSSLINSDFMNLIKNSEKRDEILLEVWNLFRAKQISFIKKKAISSNAFDILLSKNISAINIFNNFEAISCTQDNSKMGEYNSAVTKNKQLEALKKGVVYETFGIPAESGYPLVNASARFNFTCKKFEEFNYQEVQKKRSLKRKFDALQSQERETPKKLSKKAAPTVANISNPLSFTLKSTLNIKKDDAVSETHEEGRTWIKYKEGFSNAVKKKVTWESFFA